MNNTVFFACDVEYYEKYGFGALESSLRFNHHTVFCVFGDMENPYPNNPKLTFFTAHDEFQEYLNSMNHQEQDINDIRIGYYIKKKYNEALKVMPHYKDLFILDADVIINKEIEWDQFNRSIMLHYWHNFGTGTKVSGGLIYLKNDSEGYPFLTDMVNEMNQLPIEFGNDERALTKIYENYNHTGVPIPFDDIATLKESNMIWFGIAERKDSPQYQKKLNNYRKKNHTVFFACDVNFYEKYGFGALKSSIQFNHHTVFCVIGEMENPYPNHPNLTFYTIPFQDIGSGEIRSWYASVRFTEAAKLLPKYDDLLIFDADCIFRDNLNWEEFDHSIMLYYFSSNIVATKIAAGCVYVKNDESGLAFINDVSDQLNHLSYDWYRDQFALTNVYTNHDTKGVPLDIYDFRDLKDSDPMWFGTDETKKLPRYQEELDKYRKNMLVQNQPTDSSNTMPIIINAAYPDRLEILRSDLINHGIDPARIIINQGYTGKEWKNNSYMRPSPYWRDNHNPKLLSQGEANCFDCHTRAWQKVIEMNQPCIILEDDARIIGEIPTEWIWGDGEIRRLGYNLKGDWPDDEIIDGWRRAPFTWWSIGYCLDVKSAQELSKMYPITGHFPSDEFIPWMCGHTPLSNNNGYHKLPDIQAPLKDYCITPPVIDRNYDFESTTDNYISAFDLNVILFGTDEEKIKPSIDKLTNQGFDVLSLGIGEPGWDTRYEGGRQKFEWLQTYLNNNQLNDDSILLCMDGYDVFVRDGVTPNDILRVYGSFGTPCVVSGEYSYWPRSRGLENYFDQGPYLYPCSGVFIGVVRDIKDFINHVLVRYPDDPDDQALTQFDVLYSQPKRWSIDHDAKLVQSLSRAGQDINENGHNTVTNTDPLIFHANGPSTEFPPFVKKQMGMISAPSLVYTNWIYGRNQHIIPISDYMWLVPLLSENDAKSLANVLMSDSNWAPLPGDDVPGDEYRGELLNTLKDIITNHAFPILNQQISPARIGSVKDIFGIRYSTSGQRELSLHTDISHMSGSLKLITADQGGELVFPKQNWTDVYLPVGCSVWWPSAITHPHTTMPIKSGTRLGVTIWTNRT